MNNLPQILPPQKSESEIRRLLERYPLPLDENGSPIVLAYGTAGFRYNASLLESTMVRVGIAAAFRSSLLNKSVGCMVTASHNDESYNGVKLADPHGGMMAQQGEIMAVQLANASSVDQVLNLVKDVPSNGSAIIHVGRDTRTHSPALLNLTIRAAQAMGATILHHGVVTTPILHYCVMMDNPSYLPLSLLPPFPNVIGYYRLVSQAYMALLSESTTAVVPSDEPLYVDCACGVGYSHVQRLNAALQEMGASRTIVPFNGPADGSLNDGCGSEHVQKQQEPPTWYNIEEKPATISYAASVDGDADRIVFFTQDPNFTLLDGDKISVLLCDFLAEQVQALESALNTRKSLKLGVVQTAYANGASTAYLQKVLGTEGVAIAKTGVKYVHKAAHDLFDIGVYFEANGHGTILFGDKFYQFLATADQNGLRGHIALQRLQALPSLVNQAVGDAMSDLLLVDAILRLKKWTVNDWNRLYTDLPSRQCKVKVKDRTMIQTNENETRCTSPIVLQDALDNLMKTEGCRCFVRPSGTENVVRVYAEAPTVQQADALATQAAQLVHDLCEGIGDPPSFPPANSRSKM